MRTGNGKGVFIPDITVEMLKKAPIEAIEVLLSEGEILDIDIEEIKKSAYQRGLEQNKWISVNERLPEYSGTYLVTLVEEGQTWGDTCTWNNTFGGRWQDVFNGEYRDVDNVVAWMPLPEPYRGSDEG